MIVLRLDGDLVKYYKIQKHEKLKNGVAVNFSSKEKIAGKIDHPLTYSFIKELLKNNEKTK
jgi:hypothetical protein